MSNSTNNLPTEIYKDTSTLGRLLTKEWNLRNGNATAQK